MTEPTRTLVLELARLEGLTLTQKIDALAAKGYGYEDIAVMLDIRRLYVRNYMFGKKP
jgi:DNA-binding CsgD family transcriptional regulator